METLRRALEARRLQVDDLILGSHDAEDETSDEAVEALSQAFEVPPAPTFPCTCGACGPPAPRDAIATQTAEVSAQAASADDALERAK